MPIIRREHDHRIRPANQSRLKNPERAMFFGMLASQNHEQKQQHSPLKPILFGRAQRATNTHRQHALAHSSVCGFPCMSGASENLLNVSIARRMQRRNFELPAVAEWIARNAHRGTWVARPVLPGS